MARAEKMLNRGLSLRCVPRYTRAQRLDVPLCVHQHVINDTCLPFYLRAHETLSQDKYKIQINRGSSSYKNARD